MLNISLSFLIERHRCCQPHSQATPCVCVFLPVKTLDIAVPDRSVSDTSLPPDQIMADDFIRQLTHDDQEFEEQWSITFEQLRRHFDQFDEDDPELVKMKSRALDALVDYVQAEPNPSVKPISVKFIFVQLVAKHCAQDPVPSLAEVVRVACRILDSDAIYNAWHLAALEALHSTFRLCQRLTTAKSYDLIESFLRSLQRHAFLDDHADQGTQNSWQQYLSKHLFSGLCCDSNQLNDETTMIALRPLYQQIFR